MNTTKQTNTATALASAMSNGQKTPEVSSVVANHLPGSEAQKNQDRLAAAMASTAAAGTTEITNSNLKSSEDPVQGLDSPEVQKQTEKEAKKLQEHMARLAAEKNQKVAYDSARVRDQKEVERLLAELNANMTPKTRKAYKEIENFAKSHHTSTTVEKGGSVGIRTHIHKTRIRIRKAALLDTSKAKIWNETVNGKKAKTRKRKQGPGAGMAEAKGRVEQTTAVHEAMSNMDQPIGE